MKAVILASGMGTRLGNITSKKPKCLIEVQGHTILERTLTSLIANNCTDITITTGYLDTLIREYVYSRGFSNCASINYVYNPQFSQSNYIYSLWLARETLLNDDVLLLHGDLVFDSTLLAHILKESRSVVLVHRTITESEKDFKARIVNGKVVEIGVLVNGANCFLCMPFYRLKEKDFVLWMAQIDMHAKNNNITVYAENAFNEISEKISLYPYFFENDMCMEIDTEDDLVLAVSRIRI
jgi:choline kinase